MLTAWGRGTRMFRSFNIDKHYEDEKIWQGYQYLEHIVRLAKARAFLNLGK